MPPTETLSGTLATTPAKRYRLPGIEREGIAQLSLLETALWSLQSTTPPSREFHTQYEFDRSGARRTANVTVRAALGLKSIDELFLWALLGATLGRSDPEPTLLATPYWMLKYVGDATGGFSYNQLRESLLRLAVASYENTGFYNPETHEHEYVAFQFLSILLPTVGGNGETVDNDRLSPTRSIAKKLNA